MGCLWIGSGEGCIQETHLSNFARNRVDSFGDVRLKHPRFSVFLGKVPRGRYTGPVCVANLRDIFSYYFFWPSNLPEVHRLQWA